MVFILDDEPLNIAALRRVIESNGWQAAGATTLDDAIASVRGKAVDLFIINPVMPDGHGPDRAKRLLEQSPNARVLYISGYPAETLIALGIDLSCGSFLQKPLDFACLCQTIERLIT